MEWVTSVGIEPLWAYLIPAAPATTLAGTAVKLRRLFDPELGMDGSGKESDLPCLHHVLSVIEREAQSGG